VSNPSPDDIPLTPETWATAARQVAECHAMLTSLTGQWAEFRPIAEAFRRGGMLGARTAARHARRQGTTHEQ
jgi:hypothetical protein